MKRILVITWFYPPVNSSEGVVTYKLLNNSKNNYDVFTQKKSASWSYGKEDYLKNNDNINCIYANSDNLKDWKKEAINYYKENKDKYDIVMTRSMPPESHEIGYEIKRINPSIKWIASFGDPIANNPYLTLRKMEYRRNKNKLKYVIYALKNYLIELKNNHLESKILKNTDYVILNSEEQRQHMLGENSNVNYIVLPHSYDEKFYSSKNKDKNSKKIVISYFGHLDEIRNIKLFLEAINDLIKEDNKVKDKILVELYGNIGKNDSNYIRNNNLGKIIKYGSKVTYMESLEKMKMSDLLLLVDANLSAVKDNNIFFAAKLADYLGSGTPIMGITMLDGVSADILRKTNNLVVTYSKSDIKNYLRKIISGDLEIKNVIDKEFNAINVGCIFDDFLKNVNNEH